MPISKSALLSLAAMPATQAFFLAPCWPLTEQRLDPIVSPAEVGSHAHVITGGSAFAPVMGYNDTQASDCTSCMVNGDFSNYWVPGMYHDNGDGTYDSVAQHGSASMYYLNEKTRLGSGEKMESFPVGLRMLAGTPEKRSRGQTMEDLAVNYKCLNYQGQPSDHKGFPEQNCPDGVRAEITFPSCWDGKNLDSEDHKSHMAYPTTTFEAGACPPTHPHHLVVLKTEWIFETFKYQWSGKQPFVWSHGDPTGHGFHADFLMGWDYDLLAGAVEDCQNPSGRIEDCPNFAGRIPQNKQWLDPKTCEIESHVNEVVTGKNMKALPGCNPIQPGPGMAQKQPSCQDGVTLKGQWGDFAGSIGSAVNSAAQGVASAVAGVIPGADQWSGAPAPSAAPSVAPAQFYNAKPADAAAVPQVSVDAEGNVHTTWVYVTETVTVQGHAPAATGGWNDAAKRDAEEHIHKHRRAHGRRSFQ
jgi:hypothetical protein